MNDGLSGELFLAGRRPVDREFCILNRMRDMPCLRPFEIREERPQVGCTGLRA